ncbi:MAG TPA: class I SAM-dependent methyltransferase, partial [Verrucomicrobiae bacterium]|nr:class I SAM-dependent methyltransferase [Verrucomicrobiae bacterium]
MKLRLRISPAAEKQVRAGHPWVYEASIREQNRDGEMGELAVVYDRNNRFLAIGLYDPQSPLRIRIVHRGKPEVIDESWWRHQVQRALHARKGLFDEQTNGYRCIHGENDGFPGLVLDRYAHVAVLKLYTAAWFPRIDQILEAINELIHPESIVLRLSRNLTSNNLKNGETLSGTPINHPITFLETGLRFDADVIRGQKTGFFLDQRENRRQIEILAAGREVLNAFSFSGGFSVYAARGRAKKVTDLDISEHALASAERNLRLNNVKIPHESIQADAFTWIEKTDRKFDLIVLDPPSLAKREQERATAIRAYTKLAAAAIERLRPRGILLACSCSAHVSAAEFFGSVKKAALASTRRHRVLRTAGHPPDHPATFPE